MHFLKWDDQPSLRSRNWALMIAAPGRDQDILADNPGLPTGIRAKAQV
jgi:hypothetical protein